MQDIVYDNFSFLNNGLVITNIDHLTLAPRINQIEKRANRNGGALVQSQLGVKPIYIEGYYDGVDSTDAQLMYDVLAQVMNRQERLLTVPHAGSTRRYTATPQNVILSEPDGLNRLTFNFEFVVPDGHARAQTDTTIVNQTLTAPSTTIPLTIAGSVVARPLITLTYTTVTGGTNKTVSIRNARDFIGITIQRDWVSGDTVVIDSSNFQIYINDVLTAPVGRMPTWEAGAGSLFYSDTLTTRSVNILATHKIGNL